MFGTRPSKPAAPHASRIEDYALIGDCETAALVSRNGSIDWLCWPAFSSGACFAALVGTAENGFWQIAPAAKVRRTSRRYLPDSMIVETTFETESGSVALIDFMPPRGDNSDIVRIVRGISGKVNVRMQLRLRFDYGKSTPWVTHMQGGLRFISGENMVLLRTKAKLQGEDMSTISEFTLRPGEEMAFTLTYGSSFGPDANAPAEDPRAFDPHDAFDDTMTFWHKWVERNTYKGVHQEMVQRSLMTLKAMTYQPSGGIVAAVTAGLPEKIGGERNWDYRYCWLRDTAFTLLVLLA